MRTRVHGWSFAVALAVVSCERASPSEAPTAQADAPAVAGADAVEAGKGSQGDAPVPAEGEAKGQGGGLGSAVKHEVEAARRLAALPEAQPPQIPAGAALVAVVDGVPIPRTAFDEIYLLKVKKYSDRGRAIPASADSRYRRSIVERLVHHERLRRRVVELGVDVDPARLGERLEAQRRGIADWAKHLERRGETDASLRAMVVAELREALILERTGALAVSRVEVEEDYEKIKGNWRSTEPRIRASHIVVEVGPGSPGDDPAALEATARAEAERIHALVTAPGADFAAVARERSSGPSASKGGDIGIFTADRMDETFSRAAFALEVGAISKPVKTKFGFHIIHVTGKWPAGDLPIEALEEQIVERLEQRKLHQGRRDLKAELETAYPVTHHLLTPEEQRGRPERDRPAFEPSTDPGITADEPKPDPE
jgi:peptidyl-prolyl cis-trans isomerase C